MSGHQHNRPLPGCMLQCLNLSLQQDAFVDIEDVRARPVAMQERAERRRDDAGCKVVNAWIEVSGDLGRVVAYYPALTACAGFQGAHGRKHGAAL